MVVTYNDVLALWTLKRDVEDTKRTQDLELLTMRLRDSVRPESLFASVYSIKNTSSPVVLFHTAHEDDVCQEACTIINTKLPTWIRTSSVCGVFYADVDHVN